MTAMPDDHQTRIAQMRILESQRKMETFLDLVGRLETLSFPRLKDLITAYVGSSSAKNVMLASLIDAHNGGTLIHGFLKDLEIRLRFEVPKKFEMMGTLSALGATTMGRIQKSKYESFHIYNPDLLVANLGDVAGFGHITGVPGTGKTNLGCLLMEQWDAKGRPSIGNVKMTKDPEIDYTYCHRVSDVLRRAAALRLEGKPWLFINDEAGLTWLKAEAMSKRNRQQDKLARVTRKLNGKEILIEQRAKSVPTIIQDFSRSVYYCPGRPGRLILELLGPKIRVTKRLKDIPRTALPFDTADIAWLDFDVNIEALFRFITDTEGDSREQARRIITYLEEHDGEKEDEGPTTMEIQGEIREVYATGKRTQKWLAEHYGKSQQAISLICKGVVKGSLAVEE